MVYEPRLHPEAVFSYAELQACAEREVKKRQQVYPGRVERHRLTAREATRQIAMMRQIAEHYRELAERERLL